MNDKNELGQKILGIQEPVPMGQIASWLERNAPKRPIQTTQTPPMVVDDGYTPVERPRVPILDDGEMLSAHIRRLRDEASPPPDQAKRVDSSRYVTVPPGIVKALLAHHGIKVNDLPQLEELAIHRVVTGRTKRIEGSSADLFASRFGYKDWDAAAAAGEKYLRDYKATNQDLDALVTGPRRGRGKALNGRGE